MRLLIVLCSSIFVASVGWAQVPEPVASPDGTEEAASQEPSEADLARARDRFRAGLAAAERGNYAAAAAAFRDALSVRDAAPVRYNLASALFELGEDAEAFALVRDLQTAPESAAELRERAAFLERELRARGAVVSVRLGGLADGARVAGRDLGPDELDQPLFLAPGEIEVIGLRGGEVTTRRQLTLRAGSEVYVDVSVVPTPAELAREEAARRGDEPSTGAPRERSRTGLYVGIAAAALAVVAVVVVAVVVTRDGTEAPVRGDFQPGVIRW